MAAMGEESSGYDCTPLTFIWGLINGYMPTIGMSKVMAVIKT